MGRKEAKNPAGEGVLCLIQTRLMCAFSTEFVRIESSQFLCRASPDTDPGVSTNRRFEFNKSSHLFIGVHNAFLQGAPSTTARAFSRLLDSFRLQDASYRATGHRAQKIRVTAYLLWDDEHNGSADVGSSIEYFSKNGFHHPWRSTAWEIHPVMKIEVIRN